MRKNIKKITCPHCGANLKGVGFYTEEAEYTTTYWIWKDDGFYVDDVYENWSKIVSAQCAECGKSIKKFVIENELI
ncbi:MAG: hypothetical protein ABIM54_00900 [candidate division WOR-3 bacterium]